MSSHRAPHASEDLADIFGTEKDKVNCPFYWKIGACRHGEKCSRKHNRPAFSQTLLLPHMYPNPLVAPPTFDAQGNPVSFDKKFLKEQFDDFYDDVWNELSKFGKIEELHVCDNVCEHMLGNVYVKYSSEKEAQKALDALNGRMYAGVPLRPELSPVSDFREAKCKDFDTMECSRGGLCNFMHLKIPSRTLTRELYGHDVFKNLRHSRRGGSGGDGDGEEDSRRDRSERSSSSRRERSREREPSSSHRSSRHSRHHRSRSRSPSSDHHHHRSSSSSHSGGYPPAAAPYDQHYHPHHQAAYDYNGYYDQQQHYDRAYYDAYYQDYYARAAAAAGQEYAYPPPYPAAPGAPGSGEDYESSSRGHSHHGRHHGRHSAEAAEADASEEESGTRTSSGGSRRSRRDDDADVADSQVHSTDDVAVAAGTTDSSAAIAAEPTSAVGAPEGEVDDRQQCEFDGNTLV